VKSYRTKFQQRIDHPAGSATATGFILLGMAAEKYPADEYTDDNIIDMAGKQEPDGSWTAFGHRPPLEYSRITATALAVRSLQIYGPPGQKVPLEGRIARARDWLIASQPASNAEHAFRLLGLAWAGAERKLVDEQVATLLKEQRDDGGWTQLPEMSSDAYATGLTLFALYNAAAIKPADAAYQRGVEYLLKTQHADGSWFVKTRAFPLQPYFESGFPYGPDQWISATATGFAAAALMYAME
jgi:squalene cyclase